MQNITIFGGGVLGSQIAFQTAMHGKNVTVWGRTDGSIERTNKALDGVVKLYQSELKVSDEDIAQGLGRISFTTDKAEALAGADLAIEAIVENLEKKEEFYKSIAGLIGPDTIVATNSSTLAPSQMVEFTGIPERFLGLHYANHIWLQNSAEIMGTPQTSQEAFDAVVSFATETGMVAIPMKKEKAGWLLNSMLVPWLDSGSKLLIGGYAEAKEIDNTWKIATGNKYGPFGTMDIIGLNTVYHASAANPDLEVQEFAKMLKKEYLDKGKTGVASGEGFYKYE